MLIEEGTEGHFPAENWPGAQALKPDSGSTTSQLLATLDKLLHFCVQVTFLVFEMEIKRASTSFLGLLGDYTSGY